MKTSKTGFVQVPTPTMNAIKNMIFSADNGVDLSTIINDIATADNKDLTAINIALAYKGVKVDIDERPRYNFDWRNRFWRYDYTGYSLILGVVKVYSTLCEVDAEGNIKEGEPTMGTYTLEQWNNFTTDIATIFEKIQK